MSKSSSNEVIEETVILQKLKEGTIVAFRVKIITIAASLWLPAINYLT